jgi:hypothetical protein
LKGITNSEDKIEAKRYKTNPTFPKHLAKSIYVSTKLYKNTHQSCFLLIVGPALKPLINILDMRLVGGWLLAPADLVLT